VQLAHKLAIESELIKADAIESMEFPHLAHKYDVFGVPKTVINETKFIEGALPEERFMEELIKTLKKIEES
jgi:predicted DsbA family dithiol-disulfide isomerase